MSLPMYPSVLRLNHSASACGLLAVFAKVVDAHALAGSERLLDHAVAVRVHVVRAFGGLGDHDLRAGGGHVDARLPRTHVDHVRGERGRGRQAQQDGREQGDHADDDVRTVLVTDQYPLLSFIGYDEAPAG
jgi:hypothetical protein